MSAFNPDDDLLPTLAADPDRLDDVPRDDLPDLLAELERLRTRALARLSRPPKLADDAPSEPDLVRAGEVAEMLDVSRDRVYELARQDRLPNVRVGRSVRFSRTAIRKWIEDGGEALEGGWRADPER